MYKLWLFCGHSVGCSLQSFRSYLAIVLEVNLAILISFVGVMCISGLAHWNHFSIICLFVYQSVHYTFNCCFGLHDQATGIFHAKTLTCVFSVKMLKSYMPLDVDGSCGIVSPVPAMTLVFVQRKTFVLMNHCFWDHVV